MSLTATSIKIPRHLKSRIERLARRTGESAHAFMLRALEGQVEAAERYAAFLQDGVRADEAMLRSGLGYAADDVHAYLEAKIAGRRARRPRPARWRG
jgi:predicted transcriptional regulator